MNDQVAVTGKQMRKLLGQSFLMVNKNVLKNLGISAALWIADLTSKFEYFESKGMIDDRGFFYNTQDDIEKSTTLSAFQQTEITRKLKELGILEIEKRGIPSRNYYRFNLTKLIPQLTENMDTSDQNFKGLIPEKLGNINNNKVNKKEEESNTSYYLGKTPNGALHDDEFSKSLNQSTLIHEGLKAKAKEKVNTPDRKPLNGPFKKIFDYWEMSGLKSPKAINKTYDKNVAALRGLLKAYSVPDIIIVIDLFKLSLLPDYTPSNPKSKEYFKSLYFYEFVRNHKGESIFEQLLTAPPKQLKNAVRAQADPDPNITNFLKNFYMEKILGNAKVDISVADENAFRLATKKLMKFYEDNKGKYPTPWFSFGDIARVYVDAVADFLDNKDSGNGRHWGVNIFKWDDFFNKYLPAYMYDQAMLVNPNNVIGGM